MKLDVACGHVDNECTSDVQPQVYECCINFVTTGLEGGPLAGINNDPHPRIFDVAQAHLVNEIGAIAFPRCEKVAAHTNFDRERADRRCASM